jgi:PTS system mannose-specific IID component
VCSSDLWRSLRPAVGALSVALVPLVGPWAVAFFVVAYNLVHLTVRWRLFRLGLAEGEGLVARVKGWRAPTWAARLRVVAAGVAGGVAAWLSIGARGAQPFDLGFALGTVALGLVSLVLLSKRVSPYLLLVGAALLGVLLSVVGAR